MPLPANPLLALEPVYIVNYSMSCSLHNFVFTFPQVLFALLLLYLIFTAMDIWHTHKVWWLCGRRGVGVQHPPVL